MVIDLKNVSCSSKGNSMQNNWIEGYDWVGDNMSRMGRVCIGRNFFSHLWIVQVVVVTEDFEA